MPEVGATKILYCSCIHAYQDKRYGAGRRVHNIGGGRGGNNAKYRCTVCGKENDPTVAKKK